MSDFFIWARASGHSAHIFTKCEVTIRELRTPAVHLVEDIGHHLQRFVRAGDLLNAQVDIEYAQQSAEAPDVLGQLRHCRGLLVQACNDLSDARISLLHQLGDIDPERIAFHLDRLLESKGLAVQVEPEISERSCIPIENPRWFATHSAVE